MKRTLPPFPAVRAFEAAARHVSFKDAAEELHVTQSAVSHQVKGLEEFLGKALFHRAANGVTLTRAGEEYFDDVSSILDQLEESTRRNRDCEISGPLRICSTPAFAARWLLPRINAFNSVFPDIELQITTTIEPIDFRKDDVDVLLQYGRQSARGLRVDPFLSSARIPVCSPGFLESSVSIQDPEDLLQHTLLRDVVGDEWADWFKCAGIDFPETIQGPCFEHCDLSLRAAEKGQGIALAYDALITDEIASGALLKLFDIKTSRKVIYSVTCPECWINRPRVSAFRKWLFRETGRVGCTAKPEAKPTADQVYIPALPYLG